MGHGTQKLLARVVFRRKLCSHRYRKFTILARSGREICSKVAKRASCEYYTYIVYMYICTYDFPRVACST